MMIIIVIVIVIVTCSSDIVDGFDWSLIYVKERLVKYLYVLLHL